MTLNTISIEKKLSKAYLKQDLSREQIETFKRNLRELFGRAEVAEAKKEHEEHFKNIVSDFLKDTYYKDSTVPAVRACGRRDRGGRGAVRRMNYTSDEIVFA